MEFDLIKTLNDRFAEKDILRKKCTSLVENSASGAVVQALIQAIEREIAHIDNDIRQVRFIFEARCNCAKQQDKVPEVEKTLPTKQQENKPKYSGICTRCNDINCDTDHIV